ncbi:PTS sugar transporter subunit IIC [Salidesulfovibrio brasiliensis]
MAVHLVRCRRFFFALFALFRSTVSIGLLERPLVIGLFWALVTGRFETCMAVAIFFELFWLDLLPVGTFIPPHLTAAAFAALALTIWFDVVNASKVLIILFACMPLAWLGAQLEGVQRMREKKSYNLLLNWSRKPDRAELPGKLILRSALAYFSYSFVLFYLIMIVYVHGLEYLLPKLSPLLSGLKITWAHLLIAATLGGVMALRLRRAYAVLFVCAGLVLFFSFRHAF